MPLAGEWTERWWYALGSDAHCQISGGPDDLADRMIDELEELESCWSRFRPTSELRRLNADPHSIVTVSSRLAAALHRARLAWELTDGWFDPTVLEALEQSGYERSWTSGEIPRGSILQARPTHGMADVSIDVERNIVHRPTGLRFDLGGIGKGLAADLLVTRLMDRGAASVCIGLGGDVRVAGDPPEDGWRIPVECSVAQESAEDATPWFEAELMSGAIVASSTRFRRWTTVDGTPAHHLIDPHTGQPSTSGTSTVVVAAAEAWWAEALAKAALIAPAEQGRALLDRHQVQAWFAGDRFAART